MIRTNITSERLGSDQRQRDRRYRRDRDIEEREKNAFNFLDDLLLQLKASIYKYSLQAARYPYFSIVSYKQLTEIGVKLN